MTNSIEELTADIVAWADSVLPDRKPQAAFMKLFEEIGELVKDPRSAGEYADVCIMIFDLAHMHGVEDLGGAIREKLEINSRRMWITTPMGTLQHRSFERIVPLRCMLSYDIGKQDSIEGRERKTQQHFESEDHYDWYMRGYDMAIGEDDEY